MHAKILIVDDQEANVSLLEQMLVGAGYESIASTTDPEQVCELHLRNHYDLILLDLQMPGMDGFQVMEGLQEIETDSYLPVLVITAQPEHKLRALKAGAKDFVSKPFDLAEVLLRVHNMLEVRLLHSHMKKLYDRLLSEQKVSKRLVLSALPSSVVEQLQGHSAVLPEGEADLITESYAEVTALFADVIAFTKFSEGVSAEVLTGVLKDISHRFDTAGHQGGLNRTKTIGDAYLAAVGRSDAMTIRAIRAAHQAFDLVEALDQFNQHSRYQLRVRIGLHTAPVEVAEVVNGDSHYDL